MPGTKDPACVSGSVMNGSAPHEQFCIQDPATLGNTYYELNPNEVKVESK